MEGFDFRLICLPDKLINLISLEHVRNQITTEGHSHKSKEPKMASIKIFFYGHVRSVMCFLFTCLLYNFELKDCMLSLKGLKQTEPLCLQVCCENRPVT